MLVLSAIAIVTTMGVEFAYNTSIYYNLAQNEAERLQAYYLARSAYNFMRLELKFDRLFRSVVQSQNLGQYLGANAQLPLCQQFPLSTGLIRTVFLGGGLPGAEGEGGEGESPEAAPPPEPTEGDEALEQMQQGISMSQEQGAKEFLAFEGDFDGECIDEGTKIDLNAFAGLATAASVEGMLSPYDQYKQFLFKFLSQARFKGLFEASGVRIPDVVNNIGDWVDANNDRNDFEGRSGGAESALYQRAEASYPIRNGKLLTLMEAYLIDGVVDEWFEPMMDYFTVYGDGTINVCTASADVVEGVIRRYVDSNPNLPPLRLEDPEEMARLVTAVLDACASGGIGDQLKQAVSQALDMAIGSVAGTEQPQQPPQQPAQPATGAAAAAAAQSGFGALIRTDSRFFLLKLTGQVNDVMVRIKAVLDVKETDPKKWKLLYWRVY